VSGRILVFHTIHSANAYFTYEILWHLFWSLPVGSSFDSLEQHRNERSRKRENDAPRHETHQHVDRRRINADADFLADQETKLARQELRREIARAAQASAGKLVQDNLTAADRRRMVEEFLSEVGGAR